MRVVLDTNVLVSAFASPRGVSGRIFDMWEADRFELVTSEYILDELARVLIKKLKVPPSPVRDAISRFYSTATVVTPLSVHVDTIDDNDLPILGTALAGRASYLVTGDKIILAHGRIHSIPIITPRDFLNRLFL